jgi:hypothetical protein
VAGVEVDHQTVLESGHRRQREDLRFDRGFQFQHQAHGVGGELAGARRLHVGIGAVDQAADVFHDIIQRDPLQVDHQAVGVGQRERLELNHVAGFHGHPGIGG